MKELKLNWGHIIEVIALCVVGYFTYAGVAYLSSGNFMLSAIVSVLVVLLTYFMLAIMQVKKLKSGKTFNVFFYVAPIIFIVMMIPSMHFVSLFSYESLTKMYYGDVVTEVNSLFKDYESYVDLRVRNYRIGLRDVVNNKETNPQMYELCGYTNYKDTLVTQNLVHTLHTHLMGNNYSNLRGKVARWSRAVQNENLLNVNLLADISNLENQISLWHTFLTDLSKDRMIAEELVVKNITSFDSKKNSLKEAVDQLEHIKNIYTGMSPTLASIIVVIVLYLMLIVPYFLLKNREMQESMDYEPAIGDAPQAANSAPKVAKKDNAKRPAKQQAIPVVEEDGDLDKTNRDNNAGVQEVYYQAPKQEKKVVVDDNEDVDDEDLDRTFKADKADIINDDNDNDDFEDFETDDVEEEEYEPEIIVNDEENIQPQNEPENVMADNVEDFSDFDDFEDFDDYDDVQQEEAVDAHVENIEEFEQTCRENSTPNVNAVTKEEPRVQVPKKENTTQEGEGTTPRKKVVRVVKKVSSDGTAPEGEPRVRKVRRVVRKPQGEGAAENAEPGKPIKQKPIVYKAKSANTQQSSESVSSFKKNS